MRVPSAEVGKAFENFAEITKQARVVPYTVNGATTGFQIQRIAPGSVFQRIGLQDNDIIKGVNGASVTTADQALRLFTLFRNEREVVLDIQRGPDTLKYSYTIE
jgi:general secretion pathway protein C